MNSPAQDTPQQPGNVVTLPMSESKTVNVTPLQQQTQALMAVLKQDKTGTDYKNALQTSLQVLKVFAIWLFQVVLTAFAVLVWVWGIGYQGGYLFREWIEKHDPSTNELVCTMLKTVTAPFVSLYHWAEDFVATSFGWDVQFDCLETEPNEESADCGKPAAEKPEAPEKEDSEGCGEKAPVAEKPEAPEKEEEAPKSGEDCEAVEETPAVVEECG